ncbi:MAG: universal stress protein [Prevotellaceae bacterium]|jgi:nucleotide-binding universal stress UspA family protein|nr:universal stress protein [Prevotellaceae bacterium]
MNKNLITIAIRHIERAEHLKRALAKFGIPSFIHQVSNEQKTVGDGVRVRIEEKDLSKALYVLDRLDKNPDEVFDRQPPASEKGKHVILVPIDFSEYSIKACETAFYIAHLWHVPVFLLHAYTFYTPIYVVGASVSTISEEMRKQTVQTNADMNNLLNIIRKKMNTGEFPNVEFTHRIEEGIPENVILETVDKLKPAMVVMGTRGKDQKEEDLIGSVTAEVIEHCQSPVLALPESVALDLSQCQHVLFATNFDDRTLVSLDRMMLLLGKFRLKLFFTHFEARKDAWNEIKLAGIKTYFEQQYPEIPTEYFVISGEDLLTEFDGFISTHNISIVVLNTHKRNLFARLFNPSIARKMVFHAKNPILVFHT